MSGSRWRATELLEDLCYALRTTPGCTEHIRKTEGLKTLGGAPLSPGMRWGYSCGQASYLAPTSRRLEIGLTFVVDYELRANGFGGLAPASGGVDDPLADPIGFEGMAVLLDDKFDSSPTSIGAKLAALLREVAQPKVRVALALIAEFDNLLLDSFLSFTENDEGKAMEKVHRVLRRCYAWLASAADSANAPIASVWAVDLLPVKEFVQRAANPALRAVNVESLATSIFGANEYTVDGLGTSGYFERESSPFFDNPLLLQYGLLDDKGGLKATIDLLLSYEKQGATGFYESIANHMFDGSTTEKVQSAIESDRYEGPGDICSSTLRAILHDISEVLEQPGNASLTLEEIVDRDLVKDSVDLLSHLREVSRSLPISNFKCEQQRSRRRRPASITPSFATLSRSRSTWPPPTETATSCTRRATTSFAGPRARRGPR